MPCDDCLSRREFLTRGTLAVAGAALVAGCGDGQIGPPELTGTINPSVRTIKVSTVPGLAVSGQLVQIGTGVDLVGVKRTSATTFAAWSMFCTHQQCATNIANNGFDCPCHNSRFDSDGRVVRGPATRPLPSVATRYDAPSDTLTIG